MVNVEQVKKDILEGIQTALKQTPTDTIAIKALAEAYKALCEAERI